MSDIIVDNQIISIHCTKYIEQCKELNKKIAAAEKSEEISALLLAAHFRINQILYEVQIVKIQMSLQIKLVEKQITIFRNKFAKIIDIYQKLFLPKIPYPMQDVTKQIELIDLKHEESWLIDIRALGLALSSFANYAQKSSSYLIILNYEYQFTAILRNSILCKNLRPQLGVNNYISNLRREQLTIFHHYADDQIAKQQKFFAQNRSLACLENAIRITRAIVELGFVTGHDFFDIEFYKKQDEAFTRLLVDTREASKK